MRYDLHVTGTRLKKLSYLENKALNPHCFFFGLTLKLNFRHDRLLRKKYVFCS